MATIPLNLSPVMRSPLKSSNVSALSDDMKKSTDTCWNQIPNFNNYPLAATDRLDGFATSTVQNVKEMYRKAIHTEKRQWKGRIAELQASQENELKALREAIQEER
jgi:hypothetical protein